MPSAERNFWIGLARAKDLCPICGEELVKLHYLGVKRIVKEKGSPDYVGSFLDDLLMRMVRLTGVKLLAVAMILLVAVAMSIDFL